MYLNTVLKNRTVKAVFFSINLADSLILNQILFNKLILVVNIQNSYFI